MYYTFIIYSLLFLVSFATAAQGLLNENVYVKQFIFGLVFIAILAISLIKPIKRQKTILHITWADILVVSLLLIYSCFFRGTHNNLDFTLAYIYFLLYVFMRIYNVKNNEHIRILSIIIPIVISLHILICALQFFHIIPASHSYFAVGSSFGNPDALGAYLAVILPFCYVHSGQKNFRYTVLVLGIVLLLLLQARTALVATVLTGILYLLLSEKITRKQLITWMLFPFIATLGLLIRWHPESVFGRLFIWITASKMIVEKPMGWGLYAFKKHYPEFQSDYVANHQISDIFNPDLVHSPYNEFLNVGVTLGLIGLLLFILFVLFIIIIAYKARTPLLYPICSFLIISLSYHPFEITPLVIILVMFIALIINFDSQAKPVLRVNIRHKAIILIPILVIAVSLVGSSWYSYNKWQTAVGKIQDKEQWSMSNSLFEENYPLMKGNGRFLITWADLQYRMGDTSRSLSLLKEAEYFFCDGIFLKNMAVLYEETEQITEAKIYFDKAVNIVPGSFNIAYERILFLLRIGEHQKAYQEALLLYNKPVRSSYYADPFIIKSKLKIIIQSYPEK